MELMQSICERCQGFQTWATGKKCIAIYGDEEDRIEQVCGGKERIWFWRLRSKA